MNEYILDASAVLAVLQNEPGNQRVGDLLERAAIGRINSTEVLTTLINKGMLLSDAIAALDRLKLSIFEFNISQSEKTVELRPLAKHLGLSLGDRACLALAIQENAIAVTADRDWAECGCLQDRIDPLVYRSRVTFPVPD